MGGSAQRRRMPSIRRRRAPRRSLLMGAASGLLSSSVAGGSSGKSISRNGIVAALIGMALGVNEARPADGVEATGTADVIDVRAFVPFNDINGTTWPLSLCAGWMTAAVGTG